MSDSTISVIVEISGEESDHKGGAYGDKETVPVSLPIEALRSSLSTEAAKLLSILDSLHTDSKWKLEEVEVGIEISAEGGISFIGTAKAGAEASIKLTFKR